MALSRIQSVCLLLSMRYLWERCWLVACFLHFIECNMQMRQPFKSRSLKQQLQIVASVQWTKNTIGAHIPNKNTQFFVFMLVWSLFSFFLLLYSVGSTLEVLLPVQVHAWIESKRPTETKTHLGKRENGFRFVPLNLCSCVCDFSLLCRSKVERRYGHDAFKWNQLGDSDRGRAQNTFTILMISNALKIKLSPPIIMRTKFI